MSFNLDLPKEMSSIIKVIGVGGGGGNAVNYMYREGIKGVDFLICNTDSQALEASPIPGQIQMGNELTEGRGAGSNPEVGRLAAENSIEDVIDSLGVNTQMVFVTAGMGGGTGTGAAPVIAKTARDMGILTVGIVTTPFRFEGLQRKKQAEQGMEELRGSVDSLLVISNDRIKDIYGNLPISQAFSHADNVLATAAKGIAEIITVTGSINVDFEDVKTAMTNSGVSIMGTGIAEGENRAMRAVEQALSSPLLDDSKIIGASDLLVNISYGEDEATMDEYTEINEYLQEIAGMEANLKCGLCLDQSLGRSLTVTVIATGFNRENTMREEIETDDQHMEHVIESTTTVENTEVELVVDANQEQDKEAIEEEVKDKRQTTIFDEIKRVKTEKTGGMDMASRVRYLRELKERSSTNSGMEHMEKVPAFERNGITLDEISHSSESEVSRFSLVDEGKKKPELRQNNSFLHDNVD